RGGVVGFSAGASPCSPLLRARSGHAAQARLPAIPCAVDPPTGEQAGPPAVQVERPTGRTTHPPGVRPARLCLGRRCAGWFPHPGAGGPRRRHLLGELLVALAAALLPVRPAGARGGPEVQSAAPCRPVAPSGARRLDPVEAISATCFDHPAGWLRCPGCVGTAVPSLDVLAVVVIESRD